MENNNLNNNQELNTEMMMAKVEKKKKDKGNGFGSDRIKQITLSGLLLAFAVIMSFATFNLGVGKIYLVGIAIFLMPLCLKFPYMIITALSAVAIADLLNGYIAMTWISMIAYGGGVTIIWSCKFFKLSFIYFIGIALAALFTSLTYYVLEIPMLGHAYAIKDLIATLIQFAIVAPVVMVLYFPVKLVLKAVNVK